MTVRCIQARMGDSCLGSTTSWSCWRKCWNPDYKRTGFSLHSFWWISPIKVTNFVLNLLIGCSPAQFAKIWTWTLRIKIIPAIRIWHVLPIIVAVIENFVQLLSRSFLTFFSSLFRELSEIRLSDSCLSCLFGFIKQKKHLKEVHNDYASFRN